MREKIIGWFKERYDKEIINLELRVFFYRKLCYINIFEWRIGVYNKEKIICRRKGLGINVL